MPANNPANTRHGGVVLFFKNSIPVIVRNDLSIDEARVVELKFGRKKYFLLFYIEVLLLIKHLVNFKPSCHIVEIYIQKSKPKILLQYFLQGILVHILSCGGLMAIQLLKAGKLTIFLLL